MNSTTHTATLQESPPSGDAEVDALRPWFHNIHLPDGRQTAPHHRFGDFPRFKWERIAPCLPPDLAGWSVLDIGCNAGFYSVELARRGATVTACDVEPHYLRQAAWVARQCGVDHMVEVRRASVFDLLHDGRQYDLVWFMGVLYHLRYPMLALDLVARATRRLAVIQCLTIPTEVPSRSAHDIPYAERRRLAARDWPKLSFVEHCFAADPTNWWIPNTPALDAMIRAAGFTIRSAPDEETRVCVPPAGTDPVPRSPLRELVGS